MSHRILIIEDDPQIRRTVDIACQAHGYATDVAGDGAEGLAKAQKGSADLIILDIGLPRMDGLELCRNLRQSHQTPIIFLTARNDEIDRVLGLELGGDDYVSKPFSPRELLARIAAVLRRGAQGQSDDALRIGGLTLHLGRHAADFNGTPIDLTRREMGILMTLARRPQQVFPRPALVDQVYGIGTDVSDRTLDSHLRNLRAKLVAAGCTDGIETLHGIGLRIGACRGA